MQYFISLLLLYAVVTAASDVIEKKQAATAASSTSSVFAVPTPSSLPTTNSSTYDLSQHYCRLWRHASVYADGKIYIDGGNTYVPRDNGTFNTTQPNDYDQGMNDGVLVLDTSQNFTNQDTFPYSWLHKDPSVPNGLIEHALWYSRATRKIYQIGGWFSFNNVANPAYIPDAQLPESSVWEFDIDKQVWAQSSFTLINTGSKLDRPGAAANCDAPTLNQSFIFEGYVQKRSDYDYMNYTTSLEFKFLEGMLTLDTTTSPPTLSNISVPTYVGPRMNGAMIHVPIGKLGVVVQIGGQTTLNPTPYGIGIANAPSGNVNINNSFVDVYDLQTGYWFRQETFGVPDIPPPRADICTVLVSAKDGSSHNIFMIAGVDTYNSVITFEDIWVLTLPTFQWKKVHTRPGGRYGHTCHAVGENIIIVGGMETNQAGGNVNTCAKSMPAEIFSLTQMNYTGIFNAEASARAAPIPGDIVSLIGGTSDGGAVVTRPKAWSDLYLQYVFDPTLTRPAYSPNYTLANATSTSANGTATAAPSSGSSANVGAIAGGVVGGVILIALIAFLVWFLLRRRRRKAAQTGPIHEAPAETQAASELPSYDESKTAATAVYSDSMTGFTRYSPHGHRDTNDPAELHTEANDMLRPLSTDLVSADGTSPFQSPSVQSSVISSPMMTPPTAFTVPERKPVGSPATRHSLQSVSSAGHSADYARLSRQSEISEESK